MKLRKPKANRAYPLWERSKEIELEQAKALNAYYDLNFLHSFVDKIHLKYIESTHPILSPERLSIEFYTTKYQEWKVYFYIIATKAILIDAFRTNYQNIDIVKSSGKLLPRKIKVQKLSKFENRIISHVYEKLLIGYCKTEYYINMKKAILDTVYESTEEQYLAIEKHIFQYLESLKNDKLDYIVLNQLKIFNILK